MPDFDDEHELITSLLGRPPMGGYTVVVRRTEGAPVVLRNDPLFDDGRPMPTRYWLLDPALNKAIGQLEAEGGVKRAETEVDPAALARAHDTYASERDAQLDPGHDGHRPSGGVGGTRLGVKCLHAHYAHLLAGGNDPVGRWVHERLVERGQALDTVRCSS